VPTPDGRPSTLVEAVSHRDPRVRFAALEAVMRLRPRDRYVGSNQVLDALAYFISADGEARAVAADPRSHEARRLAGLLIELGYESEITTNPQSLVQAAIASPDVELVLIDFSLAAARSGELIQRLRRDSRTARVPVGIVVSPDDELRAKALAASLPLTAALIRPRETASLEYQLAAFLNTSGRPMIPAELRQARAVQTLAWMVDLAEDDAEGSDVYDLRHLDERIAELVWIPEQTASAVTVLGRLGTPNAQRALVDFASQTRQPLDMRQAAAAAFGESLARHGTLLTTTEILHQYDRYNLSESLDRETQLVLASILDHLEAQADTPYAVAPTQGGE